MKSLEREQFNELVIQAKLGNEEAFERLVIESRPLIISLVNHYSHIHSKLEFDDLYNIALYSLHKAVNTFDNRNPSFLHQAKKIINRDLIDELKASNRKKRNFWNTISLEADVQDDRALVVEEEIFKQQVLEKVSEIADETLSPSQKITFELHLKGFSNIEIAEKIGATPKIVNGILYRAKKKIVKQYQDKFLDRI